MSTTGVPSIASIGPTRNRVLTILLMVTGCRPIGFGRSGDRVAKTPQRRFCGSDRGWTFIVSRRASCSHVITIISSPAFRPSRHSAKRGSTSSQTSGAPSSPCFGACARVLTFERITPMGRNCARTAGGKFLAEAAFFVFKQTFSEARIWNLAGGAGSPMISIWVGHASPRDERLMGGENDLEHRPERLATYIAAILCGAIEITCAVEDQGPARIRAVA